MASAAAAAAKAATTEVVGSGTSMQVEIGTAAAPPTAPLNMELDRTGKHIGLDGNVTALLGEALPHVSSAGTLVDSSPAPSTSAANPVTTANIAPASGEFTPPRSSRRNRARSGGGGGGSGGGSSSRDSESEEGYRGRGGGGDAGSSRSRGSHESSDSDSDMRRRRRRRRDSRSRSRSSRRDRDRDRDERRPRYNSGGSSSSMSPRWDRDRGGGGGGSSDPRSEVSPRRRGGVGGDGSPKELEPSKVLHVRNVGHPVQQADLVSLLSCFGQVEKVKMFSGQALVQLPSVSVAKATMRHFEEDEKARIGSKKVYINYSRSRSIEGRDGESLNVSSFNSNNSSNSNGGSNSGNGLDLTRAVNSARVGGGGTVPDINGPLQDSASPYAHLIMEDHAKLLGLAALYLQNHGIYREP